MKKRNIGNSFPRWFCKIFRVCHIQYGEKRCSERKHKETLEERFVWEWTVALTEDAEVFNGLYSGLQRILDGKARKKERILREWCTRTRYRWEGKSLDVLCRENLLPLTEQDASEERVEKTYRKWVGLLLRAAKQAGISKDDGGRITLDETNAHAYVDWNAKELYPEDIVEIMEPAWYQRGMVLEQGCCQKLAE